MFETPRLLFVHAHPDDESLSNGATIAQLHSRGAGRRHVHPVWSLATVELNSPPIMDQPGHCIGELTAALRALSQRNDLPLAAGRWRDSGMAGHRTAEPAEICRC